MILSFGTSQPGRVTETPVHVWSYRRSKVAQGPTRRAAQQLATAHTPISCVSTALHALMDGSDDYFFGDDDFVLDEKTIAALDLEEQKWQRQQTQATTTGQRRPISQEARQRTPKRRKTSHETTPEGLIPQIRAVTVSDDYDEDLPDISIIGDGAYNLPAAQRASAHAQAQGVQGHHASTSNHRPAHVPAYPLRAPPPAAPQRRASSGSGSDAYGSGQSQGQPASSRPPQRNRLPRQHSTLSSVQAALADFVPPASNAAPAPTPPPMAPLSRAPASGSSNVARTTARQQGGHASPSAAVRAAPAHSSVTRPTRGASPSVSVPPQRRQSIPVAGPSRQQRASPSIPPQPPPQLPYQPPPQPPYQPPLSQGQSDRNLRIEVETLKAQLEEVSSRSSGRNVTNVSAACQSSAAGEERPRGSCQCSVRQGRRSQYPAQEHREGLSYNMRNSAIR